MSQNYKNNIILTGAGFTANFGGILAREMWSKILNNIKINRLPNIKKMVLENFDFESVYSGVINDVHISSEDKTIFQEIISESYDAIDFAIKTFCDSGFNLSQYDVSMRGVNQFLGLFAGNSGNEVGLYFTLNQDLLPERSSKKLPFGLPASQYRDYWQDIQSNQLNQKKPITLPTVDLLAKFKSEHISAAGNLWYIKLHGSQGWLSADGSKQMVLGTNKLEDIKKEPLLAWYLQIFEEVISRNGVKLFIIGYSFGDEHINSCLLRAIEKYDLKLYIISPENPEILKERLRYKNNGGGIIKEESENIKIWGAIHGYFPYKLSDIFPKDGSETHIYRDIKTILFS